MSARFRDVTQRGSWRKFLTSLLTYELYCTIPHYICPVHFVVLFLFYFIHISHLFILSPRTIIHPITFQVSFLFSCFLSPETFILPLIHRGPVSWLPYLLHFFYHYSFQTVTGITISCIAAIVPPTISRERERREPSYMVVTVPDNTTSSLRF